MKRGLFEYFKLNNVKNLYVLHREGGRKGEVYSLTEPIVKPGEHITSFFNRPSVRNLPPDTEFTYRQTNKPKVSGFSEAFEKE